MADPEASRSPNSRARPETPGAGRRIRVAGLPVVLTWGGFRCTVVVKTFDVDYGSDGGLLPYRLSVVVTVSPTVTQPTLLSSVSSDVASALGLSSILPAAQSAIATAQAALPVAAVLTWGSSTYLALAEANGLDSADLPEGIAVLVIPAWQESFKGVVPS